MTDDAQNNGGNTDYYAIPDGATTLNDLIEHKSMNFAVGNIFKACYRLGEKGSETVVYDLNKIIYYAEREKARVQRQSGQIEDDVFHIKCSSCKENIYARIENIESVASKSFFFCPKCGHGPYYYVKA